MKRIIGALKKTVAIWLIATVILSLTGPFDMLCETELCVRTYAAAGDEEPSQEDHQELPDDEWQPTELSPIDDYVPHDMGIFKMSEITLHCGNEYLLEDVLPDVPSDSYRLYTSDRNIAAVTKLGKVMTVSEGDCVITALSDNGDTDTCIVHVITPPEHRIRIALTFDDGPGDYSQDLLDFLASRDVKVTFFIVGNRVSYRPQAVLRMYEDGHEIGNHTYSHVKLSTVDGDTAKNEVSKCNKEIKKVIGVNPTVMRPPYGGHNAEVDAAVGMPMIRWSVDTRDWEIKDPDYVCEQIIEGATDGAIILCHEVHPTTIAGAKKAIDILLARGVEFMTVTDLLTEGGGSLKKGKMYTKASNAG